MPPLRIIIPYMSAFDEFILGEGAYEFIDGAINIIGHEGLLPLLEEIRRRREVRAGHYIKVKKYLRIFKTQGQSPYVEDKK